MKEEEPTVADPDCQCGHKASLHPELAGGHGRQSCGKLCPCTRYRPKPKAMVVISAGKA